MKPCLAFLLLSLMALGPGRAHAQVLGQAPELEQVRVDEQLKRSLPLDLELRDHRGKSVQLRDYFDGERPVLLTFAYHSCPMLCSMVLDAVTKSMREVPWTAGKEYVALTVSIDPDDTPEAAAKKRRSILEAYGREEASNGWDFLVADQDAIEELTDAVGFRYFYDARQDQYAHPAVMMLVTPDGKMARYLYGLEFKPSDVRLGLLEASEGRSVSTVEKVILYCYRYDPQGKGYALVALRVMQLGGAVTVAVLATILGYFWRRERAAAKGHA